MKDVTIKDIKMYNSELLNKLNLPRTTEVLNLYYAQQSINKDLYKFVGKEYGFKIIK